MSPVFFFFLRLAIFYLSFIKKISRNSKNVNRNGKKVNRNGKKVNRNSKNVNRNGKNVNRNSKNVNRNSKNLNRNSKNLNRNSKNLNRNSKNLNRSPLSPIYLRSFARYKALIMTISSTTLDRVSAFYCIFANYLHLFALICIFYAAPEFPFIFYLPHS